MIEELTGHIEKEISKIELPGNLPKLYDPISYTISLGGKRLRPLLLLLSAELFGANREQVISQAIGIELFHNFTLVHDDIMDNAPVRRGKPSVFKQWDTNTAILSGDVMFTLATEYIADCPPKFLPEVLSTFLVTARKVCEGQQMDMDFETAETSLSQYIKMIELKTAYLLAGSMKIGAILAGRNEKEQKLSFDFGMSIGTAFQLMDDYLDVFGNPESFGKQVGGDIISGKKTFLFLHCSDNLPEESRNEFLNVYTNSEMDSSLKIKKVKEFYTEAGVEIALKSEMNKLVSNAESILLGLEGSEKAKKEFINLSHQLTERNN